VIIGTIAGAVCFIAATSLKHVLGCADSLDALGVHGIGGTLQVIDKTIGLRVTEEQEREGLAISLHGERIE